MTIVEFLSYLRRLNIKLWIEGERLCYTAPQGALTPELQTELSKRKAEVLHFLRQAKVATRSKSESLLPISRQEKIPLSFAQQRLWFLDRLTPGSPAYNMSGAIAIEGLLDVAALEKSLNEIIRRHEIWRTTFEVVEGEPTQAIASNLTLKLKRVDLEHLTPAQQQAEVTQLAIKEAQQPFNLAQAPLLGSTLLQLGKQDYVLLLVVHHIVADAWSMGVLIRELAAFYDAFSDGKPSPLPKLSIQYADFAHWQRQLLQGEVLSFQLDYWKQKLGGELPVLQLPADRPRSPMPTFRGASQSLKLSKMLTEKLKSLSQQQEVTLFMTLLAALKTLLYRYTEQEDLLIGTAIAGRNRPELEELIGCFVNTLILRTNLAGNPTFLTLLKQVRQVALEAYAHQDLPFEKLVEKLQPDRELSHSPLFQVGFVLYNDPRPELKLSGLTLSPISIDSGTAKLDLTLSLRESERGLTGLLEYRTDLFDAATIKRMLEHFQTLLAGIVANPKQRLSDLPLLTAAEQQQLLVQWNDTQTDYPDDTCIHRLFEAQVERSPDAIALIFEDEQLTYRQLNERANRLARYLQALEVKPEVMVGICMERSLEMIVGLLGVLKAGGAYLPLDPAYPSERLAFMLEDAQVPVLLTQQHLKSRLTDAIALPQQNSPIQKPMVICLDANWDAIARESQENPTSKVKPDNLAYVIYTSGSTGKPKGVLLEHRGLCNLATAQSRAFNVQSDSHVLQFASFSFDASVSEVFMSLIVGATLYLGTRNSLLPGSNLIHLLRDRAITTVTLPPSVLAILPVEELPDLRTIIVAGEACSSEIVKRWASNRRIFNAYGPTETTVCATVAEYKEDTDRLSIGRPIANTKVYILDRYLQPVPIGVLGELYISSVGLARGYLNRSDLTSTKFIANPFENSKFDRLYKTGDLARYLPDGNIEFLGRIDNQVKIRGFRIELGEIEAVLSQNPVVQEAVVLAKDYQPGDRRLVAYVVTESTPENLTQQLRNYLRKLIPDYMVPYFFVKLETLPLTPNGKVDRHALPTPNPNSTKHSKAFVPPRDTLEIQLAQIGEEILNLRPISVTDNFFDLGGHSLLAVRLMAQIEARFSQELPLSTLFQAGTIEHLATLLRSSSESQWSPLVGIQTAGAKLPFFCAHPLGGNVLGYVDLARYLTLEQPFYGLQAPGVDGQREPYNRIEDLAAHYIEALSLVQRSGPYLLGGHSLGGIVAFEMAQQLQAQGQKVALLAIMDTPAPINGETPEPIDEAKWLYKRARVLERFFGENLSISYDKLQQLESEEQLSYFLDKLRCAHLIPPDAGQQMIRRILQVQKASHQALQSYIPQVYRGRITLFRASEVLAEDSGGVFAQSFRDRALAWGELTTEPVKIQSVPGNHITMLAEPHVRVLGNKLKNCLDVATHNTKRSGP